jgi:hypothetical protein
MFRMILSVNSDHFRKQQKPNEFCNGEVLCFLCGTDWILKCYLDELWLQKVIKNAIVSPLQTDSNITQFSVPFVDTVRYFY